MGEAKRRRNRGRGSGTEHPANPLQASPPAATLDTVLRDAEHFSPAEFRRHLATRRTWIQVALDHLQADAKASSAQAAFDLDVEDRTITTLLRWLDEYEAAGVASPVQAVVASYTAIREPRRTAYHEAGHAVAAVLVDFPLRLVTLTPSASRAGRYELAMTPDELTARVHQAPDGLARYLTVLLAGKAAEELIAFDEQEGLSALEDYLRAESGASHNMGSDQAKTELVKIQDRCEAWFREPAIRMATDEVAAALLKRGKLAGDEVTAIVRAAGGHREEGRHGGRGRGAQPLRGEAAGTGLKRRSGPLRPLMIPHPSETHKPLRVS